MPADHVRRCALVGKASHMPEIEEFFALPVEVRHFAADRGGVELDRREAGYGGA